MAREPVASKPLVVEGALLIKIKPACLQRSLTKRGFDVLDVDSGAPEGYLPRCHVVRSTECGLRCLRGLRIRRLASTSKADSHPDDVYGLRLPIMHGDECTCIKSGPMPKCPLGRARESPIS